MKYKVFLLCALTGSLLVSCGVNFERETASNLSLPPTVPNAAQPTVDIQRLNHRKYPRVDGSTSTLPLQATIACEILNIRWAWLEGNPFDTTRRIGPASELETLRKEAGLVTGLYHSGTHGAYVNLIQGEADLILVARSPSEDELKEAKTTGVQLDVHPIALDAFVFLVNVENPVKDLTLDEIRKIYTGQITEWAQIGGSTAPINTYQRNRNSGSQELLEKLVMRGARMIESPDMILESMMGPFNAISGDPLGIGYSVYFYAEFIYPHELVRTIGVEGVHPTSENIADRTYPLVTEVYAVVRGDTTPDSSESVLLSWLLTQEGQAAIAESGYVPIAP